MAKITILKGDPKSGKLDLSDHGKTYVNRDRPVIWKLGNASNVSDIIDIKKKDTPDSVDIFSIPPHRDGKSTNWRAHIKADAKEGEEFHYSIIWNDTSGGGPYTFDPILKVNP